jgi:hypothetical protein
MIAVEVRGRLGNQMFQFAFGLAASRRLGTDFVIADDLLRRWFELSPHGGVAKRATRMIRYRLNCRFAPYAPVTIPNESDEDPETVMQNLVDHSDYNGFYQSERFFVSAADEVRRSFRPHARYERRFRSQYGALLEEPYVCCHVRRGDYISFRGGVELPTSYYSDALTLVRPSPEMRVVYVGDDLSVARRRLAGPNVLFERNDEIIDLLLLTHASAVVTSNSSFGWWGAWLNRMSSPRVVAPRYWLGLREGREWPQYVLPERWTQLPVALEH